MYLAKSFDFVSNNRQKNIKCITKNAIKYNTNTHLKMWDPTLFHSFRGENSIRRRYMQLNRNVF
jgi:hypothetical protein